jgi:SAM-dependent methyltransferase
MRKGVRLALEIEVRRCELCGLVFLWPIPQEEELASYYKTDYREDYSDPNVEERFLLDLDEARTRVRRLLPLLKKSTRLLEIGAGSGAFLDAVRPYVGEVVGVEPDEQSRRWASRKLGLDLFAAPGQLGIGEKYDLVVLFHVLEHVRDPVNFLSGLVDNLDDNGRLVIEVPNVDDALVAMYDIPAYLDFYYQKAHLFYFSVKTLALALEKVGYRVQIQGVQRYDLSNHIRWMLTGAPGGQEYYKQVFSPAVIAAYAESLIASGACDTLWALGEKRISK